MLYNLQVLHLETTDVCQARCPLCARETDAKFDQSEHHHLSWNDLILLFDLDQLKNFNKVFACGNYGDPAAGKFTLDIFRSFRHLNPSVTLGMNTNGALRTIDWWQELAQLLSGPTDYVVFSIDGLEDTNEYYRRGVNWQCLMENAKTFISAGGRAHWDMLIYQHNQHQVEQCEQLARQMGFSWFRTKISRRPVVDGLSMPVGWQILPRAQGPIQCHALKEQSIYVDARGTKYPCCWLGHRGSADHDIHRVSLTWATSTPNGVCVSTCGQINGRSSFENQWRREIAL